MTAQLFVVVSQRARTVQMPSFVRMQESQWGAPGSGREERRGKGRTGHDEEALGERAESEQVERDAAPECPEDRDSVFEGTVSEQRFGLCERGQG